MRHDCLAGLGHSWTWQRKRAGGGVGTGFEMVRMADPAAWAVAESKLCLELRDLFSVKVENSTKLLGPGEFDICQRPVMK